jgi:hypothetical protein
VRYGKELVLMSRVTPMLHCLLAGFFISNKQALFCQTYTHK